MGFIFSGTPCTHISNICTKANRTLGFLRRTFFSCPKNVKEAAYKGRGTASKDVNKYSFFPQTIRVWNDLPESLISSSELSDDSVSKFISPVRSRD